jgi:hypothetical protein
MRRNSSLASTGTTSRSLPAAAAIPSAAAFAARALRSQTSSLSIARICAAW